MLLEYSVKEQREILDKILMSDDVDKSLEKLNKTGDLYHILPEVYNIVGFGGGDEGHKDLWEHTKQVVKQSEKDIIVRWAALFHDVGKPDSFKKSEDNKITFQNHEIKSAHLFKKFAKRTRLFSVEEFKSILFLIKFLGRAENYNYNWTNSAVRRFAKDVGSHIDRILALARADVTSSNIYSHQKVNAKVDDLAKRIKQIKKLDAQKPFLPKGIGNDIMRSFGLPADQRVGNIKNKLIEIVKNKQLEPYQSSLYYIEFIDDNREQFNIDTEITRLNLKNE